jgi:hypothetical protein
VGSGDLLEEAVLLLSSVVDPIDINSSGMERGEV